MKDRGRFAWTHVVDPLRADLREVLRGLRHSPAFTAVAIVTLALGIGATSAVFGVIDQVILRPLPYREPERLVGLEWLATDPSAGTSPGGTPLAHFRDIEEAASSLEGLAYAVYPHLAEDIVLSTEGGAELLDGAWVSADFFDVLGVDPVVGRTFVAGENEPGASQVAILSHASWQARFGGDPGVVGTAVEINGRPHEIVGVLPEGFEFTAYARGARIWLPFPVMPEAADDRGSWWLDVFGRLAPGATLAEARGELDAIGSELARQYPDDWAGTTLHAVPLRDRILGAAGPALALLFAAAGFVLLLACSNLAHLLLARTADRRREIALRMALGAGRWRVARRFVVEAVMVGLLGGVAGMVAAAWGGDLLLAASPVEMPRTVDLGLDAGLVLFAVAASVGAGLLFGLVPGLRATRMGCLALGGRSDTGSAADRRFRGFLVAGESALVLTLLIATALSLGSFRNLMEVDPGFEAEDRVVMRLTLPWNAYRGDVRLHSFIAAAEERLAALPEVRAAGTISNLPLRDDSWGGALYIEGRPAPSGAERPLIDWEVASRGYFEAAGIPLVAGRGFTAADDADAPAVTIVDETLADRYFPDGDAIGQRVNGSGPDNPWRTIVGVVASIKQHGLDAETRPFMYLPSAQVWPWPRRDLVVWTEGPSDAALPAIQGALRQLEPEIAISDVRPMRQLVSETVAGSRFQTLLLALFGGIAVALGVVGIYGVVSYAVSSRHRELGVRLALGAAPRRLVWQTTVWGLKPVASGLVAGVGGGVVAGWLMASTLFGVEPTDPAILVVATLSLTVVATLAAWMPARRAARIDPMTALRAE